MTTTEKVEKISLHIKDSLNNGEHTHEVLTDMIGISPTSFYKYKRSGDWPKTVELAIDNIYSNYFKD